MEGQPARIADAISDSPKIRLANQDTIPHAFLQSVNKHPDNSCLIYKKEHVFGFVSYKRLLNLVENFTLSLQKLGVGKGDRIAILSENRPEWVVSDLSAASLGAILAPIHAMLTSEQIRDLIVELEPKLIVVSEKRLLGKLIEIKKKIDKKVVLVYYNIDLQEELSEFKNDRCHFIEALKLLPHEDHSEKYLKLIEKVRPNDTASIIYTIGPNGKYRGVELSNRNIISNVHGTLENVFIRPDDRFLSILPLTHAFEKMAGYYIPLMQGASITYVTDIAKFSRFAQESKPSVIIGVPRLFEKSHKKILEAIGKDKFKGQLFSKAIDFGCDEKNRSTMAYRLYDWLIYKKVRDTLGGNIRFMISGGAALNPQVARFFDANGIPILEGYGLTEYSPIVSVNKPDHNKIGTVGPPIGDTQVKIADDGEILIKGPGIMKGYFESGTGPELDLENGWFRTGDLGELDEDGFIKIIGRKKEIIVLSTGKNVSPRKTESQLTLSKYIKQAAVVGDGEKQIAALLVPDFPRLRREFGLDKQAVLESKEVRAFLQAEIDQELKDLSKHEKVKRFALLANRFSRENHFLNDDGSLSRDKISTVYHSVIAKFYINGHESQVRKSFQ